MDQLMIYGIIVGVVLLLLIVIVLVSYVKSPPNTALIISGISKEPRSLTGKGGFRVPFFERLDKVVLSQGSVNVKTGRAVPTSDFIDVSVDSEVKIRVSDILLASKNFLNMSIDQIASEVKETLQGNLREMVGTLSLKELITDRDGFSEKVKTTAGSDMARLGLEILSYNIQEISEPTGLIQNLGADNTYKIKKEAAITKSESEKEVAIEVAKNQKLANDARVENQLQIETKNNELELKKLDLKKIQDTQKAVSNAAFSIQEQEQQKEINIKTVEAEIVKTQKEQELKQEAIKVRENDLKSSIEVTANFDKIKVETDAKASLENEKRKAEAELYKIEQDAKAAKARAEADAYAQEQEAKGKKAIAEAEAYRIKSAGEAEAESIRLKGLAEAESIKAQGLAEAEAMEKKAEAYSKYDNAAKMDMMIQVLPQIAENVAKPLAAIKELNIYGTDASGTSQIAGQVPVIMKQAMDTMTSATGVDMTSIVKSSTIEAKTDKNINLAGDIEIAK